jgi:hypothetical protein
LLNACRYNTIAINFITVGHFAMMLLEIIAGLEREESVFARCQVIFRGECDLGEAMKSAPTGLDDFEWSFPVVDTVAPIASPLAKENLLSRRWALGNWSSLP